MRRSLVTSLLLLLLFAVPQAHGWNSIGHMAVAYVAYQQLTPTVKARVVTLLAMNPFFTTWESFIPAGATQDQHDLYIFMMAATWPDEIKSRSSGYSADGGGGGDIPPADWGKATLNVGYSDKAMHKYWHFIDTPFAVGNLPLPAVPMPNAETQILVFRAVLASGADDGLKSYDLAWLEHLVGDIHQPLHSSTRITSTEPSGDRGGNDVKTTPDAELHAYWDDLLGNGATSDITTAVNAAKKLPAPDATKAKSTDVVAWAAEGLALAKADVYISPVGPALGPYTLTTAYHTQALAVAQQQVALAGARLAKMLNDNLI